MAPDDDPTDQLEVKPPKSVLFVCTFNAIRSQMAAGLLRRRFGPTIKVESAGIRRSSEVDYMAVEAMDELGVDLSKARPQTVADLDEEAQFDLVISLSPEAHHRMLEMVPKLAGAAEYWQTLDPSMADGNREQRLMEYRGVRDMLDQRIAKRFPKQSFPAGGT